MTNAKTTYQLQNQLRDAREQLAYMKEPADRAKLASRIDLLKRTLQASDLDGTVYRVADENLDALSKKLTALQKRAKKHDLGSFLWYVTDEHDRVENKDPLTGLTTSVHTYTYVVLKADILKLAGWQLLAVLTVEEAGVFIAKSPAFTGADEIDLSIYRDPETACQCDHCQLSRKRTATFVVQNDEGERKQVGRNCLADFLGIDPKEWARWAQYLNDLDRDLGEEGEYGTSTVHHTPVDWFLTNAATMIREYGWTSKSSHDGRPTVDQTRDNIFYLSRGNTKLSVEPTEADEKLAADALDWAQTFLYAKVETGKASDFDHNLYIAATNGIVTHRTEGTLAYLPVAYNRYREVEIERKRAQESKTNEHFGSIGDRVNLTLTVTKVFETETRYGVTFITTLEDEARHEFKWFGSYELDRGAQYTATWTIKGHDEWKGTKQTVITRPGKLARAGDTATA